MEDEEGATFVYSNMMNATHVYYIYREVRDDTFCPQPMSTRGERDEGCHMFTEKREGCHRI